MIFISRQDNFRTINFGLLLNIILLACLSTVGFCKDSGYDDSVFDNDMNATEAPEWMIELMKFQHYVFLNTVEPIIVRLLGPVDPSLPFSPHFKKSQQILAKYSNQSQRYQYPYLIDDEQSDLHQNNRRLDYLPAFVKNKIDDTTYFQETSMSFATFTMLLFIMSCILMVFLNCFYHNQKTSPLFISPRRHRLPNLVPPPLPVDGFFKWVRNNIINSRVNRNK